MTEERGKRAQSYERRGVFMVMKDGVENICGQNIKKLRELFGLTQKELANRLNEYNVSVTGEDIDRIEKLKAKVYDIHLKCFSKIFDVSSMDIMDENLLLEDKIKVVWAL